MDKKELERMRKKLVSGRRPFKLKVYDRSHGESCVDIAYVPSGGLFAERVLREEAEFVVALVNAARELLKK